MRKKTIILVILCASTLYLFGHAARKVTSEDKTTIIQRIDEVIEKAAELEIFSGCVLVAKGGKIFYSRAVGDANKDFHIKNTLHTRFDIGSIGKSFTALAIMILAQKRLLNIYDPVTKYLCDFPFGEKITIHHLLTHTSGLGNFLWNPTYLQQKNKIRNVNNLLSIIYKETPEFKKPGKKMVYSNSGIVVLGAIIEKVSGITYPEFLQRNIFTPLNMKNTSFNYPDDIVPFRAIGYIKKMSGGYQNNCLFAPPPSPAGGLLSTVEDLLLYDQSFYKNSLLTEKYKRIMFTPYINKYACCWMVFEKYNNTVIGHSGGASGISARIRRYIHDKYTIIVLSNYDNGANTVFFRIESILFGKEYTIPKIPVGEYLYSLIQKDGLKPVVEKISDILKKENYQIPNPGILNVFGYNLLNQNNIKMAIAVFLINTYLFKNDANVFDSLGEAYMKHGDKRRAIKNYRKSLKLDPKNTNAVEMLKKLKDK